MTKDLEKRPDTSILLSGQAGQGIQTIQKLLMHALRKEGYHVFATKEVMSRIRGGVNTTQLRVGAETVNCPCSDVDIFVPLTAETTKHLDQRLTDETLIVGEKETFDHERMVDIPFVKIAEEAGNKLYANSAATGFLAGIFAIQNTALEEAIREHFSEKSEEVVAGNIDAAHKGYDLVKEKNVKLPKSAPQPPHSESELLINGGQAVALGALAGNCNVTCSYPMSPSTAVLTNMAEYSQTADVLVEQTEDEIAAINMALGVWYAGGRALVTTSGGGFSLMCEGLSLAGMIETPLVLHLAQRPGPATGLPTRTEQGDLNLALYGGHGEFPRILLAPGDLDEGFQLTQKAFTLADKYQVPVIILTDQYFIDSFYNTPMFDLENVKNQSYVVGSDNDYKRFALTDSGISPRSIPGKGTGLVNVDSDEHDEKGYITEDLAETRPQMNHKRTVLKASAVQEEVQPPTYIGPSDASYIIVGWGSTKKILLEAVERIGRSDLAVLHFSQVYPLPSNLDDYLGDDANIITAEQNSSGQFTKLLEQHTGKTVGNKILKSNGLPFFSDELANELNTLLKEEE